MSMGKNEDGGGLVAAKWAKGPWEASIRTVQPEMGGNHEFNATVRLPNKRTIHLGGGRLRTDADTIANARLIALAPEMAEALLRVHQFLTNGIELGFIRMPDPHINDPATVTPEIVSALVAKLYAA